MAYLGNPIGKVGQLEVDVLIKDRFKNFVDPLQKIMCLLKQFCTRRASADIFKSNVESVSFKECAQLCYSLNVPRFLLPYMAAIVAVLS